MPFVETAQSLSIEADAPLKPASQFQHRQETKRVDAIAKATGTAEFGIDVDVPDMHYAVIVRPPVTRARRSHDAASAKAMPGVINVFEVSTGVAVVAETFWQASKRLPRSTCSGNPCRWIRLIPTHCVGITLRP